MATAREDWERPYTERLGRLLFELRFGYLETQPRLTQRRLAPLSGLSPKGLEKIEQGVRRTRRATLERIARALTMLRPGLGTEESVLGQLLEAAGPALAPPNAWSAAHPRQSARRERRRAAGIAFAEFLERRRAQRGAAGRR